MILTTLLLLLLPSGEAFIYRPCSLYLQHFFFLDLDSKKIIQCVNFHANNYMEETFVQVNYRQV